MIALLLFITAPNDAVTRARFYGAVAGIPAPADTSREIAIHGRVYEDGSPAEVTEALPDVRDAYAFAIVGALRGLSPPSNAPSYASSSPIAWVRVGRTHVIMRDGHEKVEAAVRECAPRTEVPRVVFVEVSVQSGKVSSTGVDAACVESKLRDTPDGVTAMAVEVGPLRPLVELRPAPSNVREILQSAKDAIRACEDPNAPGTYRMRFVIAATGDVSAVEPQGAPPNGSRVSQCIAKAVRTLRFPKPQSGVPVIVTYPFVFKQQL